MLRPTTAKITSRTSISQYICWSPEKYSDVRETSKPNSTGSGPLPSHADPAGDRVPLAEQVLADEDQPERDDRQVEPAQPAGQRRRRAARGGRRRARGEQPDGQERDAEAEDVLVLRVAGHHRRGVGAHPDEEGVAEGDLSRVAGDQVQADGADGEHAAGGQPEQHVVEEDERRQHGDQQQSADAHLLGAGVEQRHVLRVVGVHRGASARPRVPARRGRARAGAVPVVLGARLGGGHTRSTSLVPKSP